MTRILAIVLLISGLGNAGLAWWGIHEHTAAATASVHASLEISQAATLAAKNAKKLQHEADQRELQNMQTQRDHALAAVSASKDKADAANTQAALLSDRIQRMERHAKPTDCINQPVPSGVRSVLSKAVAGP